MDIKLNARLSAYSRVEGVITPEIDFDRVTHAEIDTLFQDSNTTENIPEETLVNSNRVSRAAIDSLFD